jgi:putative DNA primase/helicase
LLCKMLSQTRAKPRILGQSQTPELTAGAFVAATGNNLILLGDLTRRALLCRLDPKCERPETRVFDRNALALARADRPGYVAAVLTILRGFHVAGRPAIANRLGSFEDWSDLIRGALLWLGYADPVESMEAIRKADPRRADLANVAAQWRAVIGDKRVTVADVVKIAGTRAELREALFAVAGERGAVNNRRLGKWLAEGSGRIVDGFRFEQCGERKSVRSMAVAASIGASEGRVWRVWRVSPIGERGNVNVTITGERLEQTRETIQTHRAHVAGMALFFVRLS